MPFKHNVAHRAARLSAFAAGALIAREAGGTVTRYNADEVDLFRGQIVASNGRIHDAVLQVIGAHHR